MDPLLLRSATALAADIREGRTTSLAVVDAHIARIRRVNPTLNAVVADRFRGARAEAREADAAVARGDALGPLHGVPCTIKEAFGVEGMPWTGGLARREGTVAPEDAPTVARLRGAGAIVLGVTNLSELCMWYESANRLYGRTTNAYDAGRIAGGSSGGEGAIVGAGGSPFGLGADVGGSIRMPAFFNGVFGHKPSPGLVPNVGQFPVSHGEALQFLCSGPIARRAEDLMPLLRLLAGAHPDDPVARDVDLGDPHAVSLEGLRVLDVRSDGRGRVDAGLDAAQGRAAEALRRRGAHVVPTRFQDFRHAFDIWSAMLGEAEGAGRFRKLLGRRRRRELLPHLAGALVGRSEHTLPAVVLGLVEDVGTVLPAREARFAALGRALRDEVLGALGDDGVLLYPSHPVPAPRHGEPLVFPLRFAYTALFNVLRLPVTQVPLGLDGQRRPLGVQVVGRPDADHVPIAVAMALEADLGGWVPPR